MQPSTSSSFEADILAALASVTDKDVTSFSADTALVGQGAAVDSQALLRLLLSLEEVAEDKYGKRFEWMTDAAFSATRSPFRNVASLAEFMAAQLA